MPTAAKLAAAILFGALAWLASELVKPLFPEGAAVGRFAEWNALIGAVIGWRVAGTRARTTWPNAVAYGLTTAFGMASVALFLHSMARMLGRSFSRVYEGPMEALIDVVRLMVENAPLILSPPVLLTLLIGGALGGLATEWVARNYR
jgi:hypothetical protein